MLPVPFFEEKQVNAPWMGWVTVFAAVGTLVVVVVKLSERWYNTGSIAELIAGTLGVILIGGSIAWLAFTHQLAVSIDKEGISYVFVPSFYEAKRITADNVESFELRKLVASEMFGAKSSSRLKSKLPKKEICVVAGMLVVDLRLKDGRHVLLGTNNPDGMLWALKKLQKQD